MVAVVHTMFRMNGEVVANSELGNTNNHQHPGMVSAFTMQQGVPGGLSSCFQGTAAQRGEAWIEPVRVYE